MHFKKLQQMEEQFLSSGYRTEYRMEQGESMIPGDGRWLNIARCRPLKRSGYYHAEVMEKERIVLHFTVGHLKADIATLTINRLHVSAAFVIARNGTIIQLFSPEYWSGHIGNGIGNSNNAEDKKTIAIELSNYGPLLPVKNLETVYSRKAPVGSPHAGLVDTYCSMKEAGAYTKLDKGFRGHGYFAAFTDAQYESLSLLLRYLTARFDIPRSFLPETDRYVATDKVKTFKGIVSHVNYRASGKWDIGPAFDWARVIGRVSGEEGENVLREGAENAKNFLSMAAP